jgi:hypothetical protein
MRQEGCQRKAHAAIDRGTTAHDRSRREIINIVWDPGRVLRRRRDIVLIRAYIRVNITNLDIPHSDPDCQLES